MISVAKYNQMIFHEVGAKLFDSSHITVNMLMSLIVVFIIGYIVLFYVVFWIDGLSDHLNTMCFVGCETEECKEILRRNKGTDYLINAKSGLPNDFSCLISFWEVSHFITHIFIGYFFNLTYSLGFGIGFEVIEHYHWNCESYLDIIANTLGALIGIAIRVYTR